MGTAKSLVRLYVGASSPKPLLFAFGISTLFTWIKSAHYCFVIENMHTLEWKSNQNGVICICCFTHSLLNDMKHTKPKTWVVPEVRRQSLKCFKITSDIDITLHVCTLTCVFHIVAIHKQFNQTLLHEW